MSLLNVLSFAAIPAVAVVAGGVLASLRPPGAAMRSAAQHFAVFATKLLAAIVHRPLLLQTISDFARGVVAMSRLQTFNGKGHGAMAEHRTERLLFRVLLSYPLG